MTRLIVGISRERRVLISTPCQAFVPSHTGNSSSIAQLSTALVKRRGRVFRQRTLLLPESGVDRRKR